MADTAHDWADERELFGLALEAARLETQLREGRKLSYGQLAREMAATLRCQPPTSQTVAEYHRGHINLDTVPIEWVVWLADRYGASLRTLSPTLGERVAAAKSLLSRSRCINLVPERFGQISLPFESLVPILTLV
jgi:hypothetical protein